MALADIDTIVYAMMENRSFDHMMGYLSLDETPHRMAVEGLRSDNAWRGARANMYNGAAYPVRPLSGHETIDDPPHGYESIAKQIDTPPFGPGPTKMGGFVESYAKFSKQPPHDRGAVMGYYDAKTVWMYDFFARNFCLCDHWFAALPLGTQANRLMAMSGESLVLDNQGIGLPDQPLVYNWLTGKVPWCVYQSGGFFPFFTLMGRWQAEIIVSLTLGKHGRFRRYKHFREDWQSTKAMPNVIFVEPQYGDGPGKNPNDDHPPTGVGPGQALLADLYGVLTSNPARWAKTLLIVTYDEHGGFFDHVPPIKMPTTIIQGKAMATTGPRVPAFLVSPHVPAGKVFSEPLDHTSFLQVLDARFGGGQGYSPAVVRRQMALGRIEHALAAPPRTQIPRAPAAPATPVVAAAPAHAAAHPGGLAGEVTAQAAARVAAAAAPPSAPDTPNAVAFDAAARKLAAEHPALLAQPGWEDLRAYLATQPPPDPASVQR